MGPYLDGFLGFDVSNPGRRGQVECFRAIEEGAAYVRWLISGLSRKSHRELS